MYSSYPHLYNNPLSLLTLLPRPLYLTTTSTHFISHISPVTDPYHTAVIVFNAIQHHLFPKHLFVLLSSSSFVLPHIQPPPQSFHISAAAAAAHFTRSSSSSRTSSTHCQSLSLHLYQYQPSYVRRCYECALFLL